MYLLHWLNPGFFTSNDSETQRKRGNNSFIFLGINRAIVRMDIKI